MDNAQIAKQFRLLGQLMEVHGENAFKIRSYTNAYRSLRKLDSPLAEMKDEQIKSLQGVGNAIAAKIRELVDSGKMSSLEKYRAKTPKGVEELLNISGFGPKKVATVWKELDVTSPGELLYACQENRLTTLKGFGAKTQASLVTSLQHYEQSLGKYRYADIKPLAVALLNFFNESLPECKVQVVGDYRRSAIVVDKLEFVTLHPEKLKESLSEAELEIVDEAKDHLIAKTNNGVTIYFHFTDSENYESVILSRTGSKKFIEAFNNDGKGVTKVETEKQLFEQNGFAFVPPELRESDKFLSEDAPILIEEKDIKGILHAHSTYSDGRASLREMAIAVLDQGYEYLGITDHSRIAVYANGLPPDRVRLQWREIDELNAELAPFRVFKGIEADILADGDLDYDLELLQGFDFVIASVHSNLTMDKEKAMMRMLRAIEHPCTSILGHPTGRLLLSRPGYEIDHKAIIEACAENGVAIELNANPHRLDIDWSWIPYAIEKGVPISINPDAHSIAGIKDVKYGVLAARKGELSPQDCLNHLGARDMEKWFSK